MSALDADLFDERLDQPLALGRVALKNDPLDLAAQVVQVVFRDLVWAGRAELELELSQA